MGKLRTSGALADRPDIGRTSLQPIVDLDITAIIQRDADLLEPNSLGIGHAARGNQNVAAFNGAFALGYPKVRRVCCARFASRPLNGSNGDWLPAIGLRLSRPTCRRF